MFNVGDKIQIVSQSDIFSMWVDMAKIMGLKNWIPGAYPRERQIGTITNAASDINGYFVYGIEIEGRSYIISERGIKHYKERKLW